MKKSQTPVFATTDDWLRLVSGVLAKRPVTFSKTGMFEAPDVQEFDDGTGLESFASYLVLDKPNRPATRPVAQRGGGTKHALDQLDNPGSVVLQIGGMEVDRLVAGQIGTVRTEQAAQDLYESFLSEVKKQFVKIKSYYVGPEAAGLLDAGHRLSPTSKSPSEYDLTR
ncbi:hypothetical protein J2789_005759 [Variovorax paradoxus]|uniref:hypothetical protein n=1 Tax=Variovorax atrisoli TaxID=3394203 RepID=UPI0011A3B2E3|nr:hypothetical protein [Variovorax paradoxus]MDR6523069.1 hypothetical protein [Variovorax paradoxus]